MRSDILIIGGGVIGLSIARELAGAGSQKVTLVERSLCGGEASSAAAGMLSPQAEADGADPFFELCSASRDAFPALAAELADETSIDIGLDRTGTFYLGFNDSDSSRLAERYAWQAGAGLAVERVAASDVLKSEPFVSPDVREGLHFPNDWQVDNRKLVAALRRSCEIRGVEIRENTPIDEIVLEQGKAEAAISGDGSFVFGHVVLATGAWSSAVRIPGGTPLAIKPVRGQIIEYRTAKRLFGHVLYTHRGYLVPRADGRVLAGSTTEREGFDHSITEEARERLIGVTAEISPGLGSQKVVDQWSGLRPFAADGLPVLGSMGVDALTVATAHYRNGILLSPITARIVAENILTGAGHWAFDEFSVDRFAFANKARS